MRVRHTSRARGHLKRIHLYLVERDSQAAVKVMGRLAAAVALLEEFPHLGHTTSVPGSRVIVAAGLPYLIVYRATDDEVIILGVFHAAQNKKP